MNERQASGASMRRRGAKGEARRKRHLGAKVREEDGAAASGRRTRQPPVASILASQLFGLRLVKKIGV
jgi:hypothetical protein